MIRRCIRLSLAALLSMAADAYAQAPSKPDTAPHTVRFVTVDKDVRLEVLDWGGTGRPLIFLPGGGGTAHDFDTFAPRFTVRHHVYGITRRGSGASSAPPLIAAAYAADRLGEDVMAVIDSLKIDRPVLAGWSLAGIELSAIGSKHPEGIAGLIYLDAAYSYGYYDPVKGNLLIDANELRNKLDALIARNGPELIGPVDPTVKTTMRELLEENLPRLERDLRYWQEMAQSLPVVPQSPNGPVNTAILLGAQRISQIETPVLAIFADPHVWPILDDPAAQAAMRSEDAAWVDAAADAFEAGVPSAHVVRLPDASHELWKSNRAEVEREMNNFMDGLRP